MTTKSINKSKSVHMDPFGKPPPGLSPPAAKWFRDCVKQFRFRTAGELGVLAEAARALTRIEACAAAVKRDGLFIPGAKGLVSHPGLRAETQARAQFLAACRQLGISRPVAAGGSGD